LNIYYRLKKLACSLLGQWFCMSFSPTGIHPVADTDPDPASILSWSDLYLMV